MCIHDKKNVDFSCFVCVRLLLRKYPQPYTCLYSKRAFNKGAVWNILPSSSWGVKLKVTAEETFLVIMWVELQLFSMDKSDGLKGTGVPLCNPFIWANDLISIKTGPLLKERKNLKRQITMSFEQVTVFPCCGRWFLIWFHFWMLQSIYIAHQLKW